MTAWLVAVLAVLGYLAFVALLLVALHLWRARAQRRDEAWERWRERWR